jgi:hypothetical protein
MNKEHPRGPHITPFFVASSVRLKKDDNYGALAKESLLQIDGYRRSFSLDIDLFHSVRISSGPKSEIHYELENQARLCFCRDAASSLYNIRAAFKSIRVNLEKSSIEQRHALKERTEVSSRNFEDEFGQGADCRQLGKHNAENQNSPSKKEASWTKKSIATESVLIGPGNFVGEAIEGSTYWGVLGGHRKQLDLSLKCKDILKDIINNYFYSIYEKL